MLQKFCVLLGTLFHASTALSDQSDSTTPGGLCYTTVRRTTTKQSYNYNVGMPANPFLLNIGRMLIWP